MSKNVVLILLFLWNEIKSDETEENFHMLDYEFFSYDVVDHRTLLIEFDLTKTLLYRHGHIVYDGFLYISKIPLINEKINIGPFSGSFKTTIDATIVDHLTFCLILVPNKNQTHFNVSTPMNRTSHPYRNLIENSFDQQQKHIVHYCSRLGPDEDRHRHRLKQGSDGDHVLLMLQLLMIVLFLTAFQVVHTLRDRQINKIRRDSWFRKKIQQETDDVPEIDSFDPIDNEEKETSSLLSVRQSPTLPIFDLTKYEDDTAPEIEHILSDKPWPRLKKPNRL